MAESEKQNKQPEVKLYSSHQEAEEAERAYWRSKTPLERLAALEQLRSSVYGYDPLIAEIKDVFTFGPLKGS